MDSSASPSTFPPEDDGSLSVAAALAKDAALLFDDGNLVDCLRVLEQLLQKKPDDPKVHHNIAIVENLQDGYSDPRRLVEALESVKKQIELLSCASRKQLESSNNNGSKSASMKLTSNAAHQLSSSVVRTDESDNSVVVFNIAFVWFHLHQYSKSFSYLDSLYQNIESIDKVTAAHICILLLDVALHSHHASRFSDVISFVEKAYLDNSLYNQVAKGTSAQPKSLLVSKSTSLPSNSNIYDGSHSDSVDTANTLALTRTFSDEALEDEASQLLAPLNIHHQNTVRRSGIAPSNNFLRTQEEEFLSDLGLKLHLYKGSYFILTQDLEAARHELTLAMCEARGRDQLLVLYLKSQLEYACGNHDEAIRLLESLYHSAETGVVSMCLNNLGCAFFRLGKLHTSGALFSRALHESYSTLKELPRRLLTRLGDKSLLISYNCGMYMLASGQPIKADRYFQKSCRIFSKRPLLWLRRAECCLMALQKGLIKSASTTSDRPIRANVIGQGNCRSLTLECESLRNGKEKYVREDDKLELSLCSARHYLVTVLALLDHPEGKSFRSDLPPSSSIYESSGESKISNIASGSSEAISNGALEEHVGNHENVSLVNSLSEYELLCLKEDRMIRQAALANLAYAELEVENPKKALSWAKSLLELPECSKIYIFLGTMYMAEALCLLNRAHEAADCLKKYMSAAIDLPYNRDDYAHNFVQKVVCSEESNVGATASNFDLIDTRPEEARGVFYANYAANLALLEYFDQAHECVTKALSYLPDSPKAILTATYLDLKRRNTKEAIVRLKQYKKCIRFVGRG